MIKQLKCEMQIKQLITKPEYTERYQPQPIWEILKWFDYFLWDWYYWNQIYVDYYRLIRKKSKLDFQILVDKLTKGVLDGLQYQKLQSFPIMFLGESLDLQYNFNPQYGLNKQIDIGLITYFFIPEIGDLFIYNDALYMIQGYSREIHKRVWRCKQEYIGSYYQHLKDLSSITKIWYTEDDIKTLNSLFFKLHMDMQKGEYIDLGKSTNQRKIQEIITLKDLQFTEWLNKVEKDSVVQEYGVDKIQDQLFNENNK